jgi:hypothetical protein
MSKMKARNSNNNKISASPPSNSPTDVPQLGTNWGNISRHLSRSYEDVPHTGGDPQADLTLAGGQYASSSFDDYIDLQRREKEAKRKDKEDKDAKKRAKEEEKRKKKGDKAEAKKEREREKEREKQEEAEEWERGSEQQQQPAESEKEKERKKRERIASSLARIGHKGATGPADEVGAQTFVRYAESEDETLSIGKKRDRDAAAATTIVTSGLPDGSSDDKQPIEQLAVLQPQKESKKKREKEKERDSEQQQQQQHNDKEEQATFDQKSERKESKKKKERDKDEPPLQQQQKVEDGDEDKSGGSDKDREKRREVRKNISPSEERRKRDKREEKIKAERAKEKNENGAGSDSETPATPVAKKKPLAGSREGKAASKAAKEELREKRRSLERKTKEGDVALGQVAGAPPTSTALIVVSSGSAPVEAESSGSTRKVSGGASALGGGGGAAQPDREDSGEFYRHLSEGVPRILDQVLTPQRVRRDKPEAAGALASTTEELSSATADAEADTEAAVEPGASDTEPLAADVAASGPASAGSGIKLTRSTLAKILFEEPDAAGASPVATDELQREEPPLPAVEQPMEDEPWAIYLGMVGPNADDEEAEEELLHLYQQQQHPFSAEELGGETFITLHDDLALPRSQSYSPTLTAATRPMPIGSPLRVLSPPGSAPSERASSAAVHSTSPSPPPSGLTIQPSPRSQSPPPSPPRLDRPTPHRYLQPDRSITPPTASTSAHLILSDADRTTSAPVLPPSSLGSGVSAMTALPAHLHIDPSTDYRKAIARVAAQLHPDLALSKMSLVVMNKIVNLVFDRIATLVLSSS